MNRYLSWKIALILFIAGISSFYAFPLNKRINLGLDLKGGMYLVLRVDTSNLSQEAKKDAAERAREKIWNRIDEFGVREPLVQIQGKDNIVVQLPGVTDRERALDLIEKTGFLEFKLVSRDTEKIKQALAGDVPEGLELKYLDEKPLLLEKKPVLTGEFIEDARVEFDQSGFGQPYVSLTLNSEGTKKFAKLTRDNVGRQLAIVLDGRVRSAPSIREPIPSGRASISGRFTLEEAKDLALILRVGALPAPLYIEEERTIGPTLGQDSINSGIRACILGAALVIGFMFFYYIFAGLIATFALSLNFLIILGGLGLFGATLTLPGIAGMILTLGMSVDANVLIYERIREELKAGRKLRQAIGSGYHKALSAILDANVTTLIAAFLLFQFGTGPIRGFAVTLTLGILASMFTAIFVTRVIFDLLLLSRKFHSLPMLRLIGSTSIDFVGKRRLCYILSIGIIGLGMFSFLQKGKANFGVDLAGGQLQEYAFQKPLSISEIRRALKDLGLTDASIQQFKERPGQFIIRTSSDSVEMLDKKFRQDFPENTFERLRVEKVGPVVSKILKQKALKALSFALLGILVYVGIRFRHLNFAVAGVIALFHDILITLGFLALSARELNLLTVTCLLTIAGYSINDTIVVYDRLRELAKSNPKLSLAHLINLSINQTLSRTLLTTLTSLLAVLSIYFFGGETLKDFSFGLLVGFLSGVYSTMFIASPLVLTWSAKRGRL